MGPSGPWAHESMGPMGPAPCAFYMSPGPMGLLYVSIPALFFRCVALLSLVWNYYPLVLAQVVAAYRAGAV